jgi:hypothetical protein
MSVRDWAFGVRALLQIGQDGVQAGACVHGGA